MTNKKISDLAAASTPLAGTELVPIWNGTATVKVSIDNLTAGRTVPAARIVSGNTNNDMTITASTSSSDGPFIQLYGLSSAAPGWTVYASGVTDFAAYGIESHWKNDFAGTSTYLGGWFSNGNYKVSYGNLVIGTSGKGVTDSTGTILLGFTSTGTVLTGGSETATTGAFPNVGTAQTVAITDGMGGSITITGIQPGVGHSTWIIPFAKRAGNLALGTASKAIFTADPLLSVLVSGSDISITPLAANTYITYAIQYTPFGA